MFFILKDNFARHNPIISYSRTIIGAEWTINNIWVSASTITFIARPSQGGQLEAVAVTHSGTASNSDPSSRQVRGRRPCQHGGAARHVCEGTVGSGTGGGPWPGSAVHGARCRGGLFSLSQPGLHCGLACTRGGATRARARGDAF